MRREATALGEDRPGPRTPDGRLITIDILRGLAILWVVLFHLWGVSAGGGSAWRSLPRTYYERLADRVGEGNPIAALTAFSDLVFRLGYNGVTVFMILSGVSLTLSASRRRSPSLIRSYAGRLRKLLVPYWVAVGWYVLTIACVALYRTHADGGTYTNNFQYLGFGKLLSTDRVVAGLLIVPRGLDRQYLLAPSPTLWFVLLLAQYYLLFPPLSALLRRVGPIAFVAIMSMISVTSTAWLIYEYGSVGYQLHYWASWFPFRLLEFGAGMAIGYAMVHRSEVMGAVSSRPLLLVAIAAAGIGLHSAGSMIDDRSGYWNAIAYPLVTAGFALVVFDVVALRPGAVLTSAPLRLIAFIGTISYAVLIVNESFLYLNDYFILHGDQWSAGWWYFVVVLYVPLTVVLAYPMALVLGLLPRAESKAGAAPSPSSTTELAASATLT